MKATDININKVMKNVCVEIKVKGIPRYKFKVFLARNIIRLAVWILGCEVELSIDNES